jgi:lycopene beta-cyclase
VTYLGFLIVFLVVPILLFSLFLLRERQVNRKLPPELRGGSPGIMLSILIVIAVIYTTPWDNYLVATRVWWYDPARVIGFVIGWVPIEEYTFFILQPILTGLWVLILARRLPVPTTPSIRYFRPRVLTVIVIVWLGSIVMLVSGWQPGKYLGIELVWALPPIMLQIFVGAPSIWQHRRLILFSILSATIYLSAADTLAISTSIWTIDPSQSLNIFIGGKLPIEEFVFFLLTNTLVVLGLVLGIDQNLRHSARTTLEKLRGWRRIVI